MRCKYPYFEQEATPLVVQPIAQDSLASIPIAYLEQANYNQNDCAKLVVSEEHFLYSAGIVASLLAQLSGVNKF